MSLAKIEENTESKEILSLRASIDKPNVLILDPEPHRKTFSSGKGLPELQEEKRQLCMANDHPEKYWEYLARVEK